MNSEEDERELEILQKKKRAFENRLQLMMNFVNAVRLKHLTIFEFLGNLYNLCLDFQHYNYPNLEMSVYIEKEVDYPLLFLSALSLSQGVHCWCQSPSRRLL
jgi:hypothetical protein